MLQHRRFLLKRALAVCCGILSSRPSQDSLRTIGNGVVGSPCITTKWSWENGVVNPFWTSWVLLLVLHGVFWKILMFRLQKVKTRLMTLWRSWINIFNMMTEFVCLGTLMHILVCPANLDSRSWNMWHFMMNTTVGCSDMASNFLSQFRDGTCFESATWPRNSASSSIFVPLSWKRRRSSKLCTWCLAKTIVPHQVHFLSVDGKAKGIVDGPTTSRMSTWMMSSMAPRTMMVQRHGMSLDTMNGILHHLTMMRLSTTRTPKLLIQVLHTTSMMMKLLKSIPGMTWNHMTRHMQHTWMPERGSMIWKFQEAICLWLPWQTPLPAMWVQVFCHPPQLGHLPKGRRASQKAPPLRASLPPPTSTPSLLRRVWILVAAQRRPWLVSDADNLATLQQIVQFLPKVVLSDQQLSRWLWLRMPMWLFKMHKVMNVLMLPCWTQVHRHSWAVLAQLAGIWCTSSPRVIPSMGSSSTAAGTSSTLEETVNHGATGLYNCPCAWMDVWAALRCFCLLVRPHCFVADPS